MEYFQEQKNISQGFVWFFFGFFSFFMLPDPGVASEPSLPSLQVAELLDLCCATGLLKCFSPFLQEVCSEWPPQDLQAPDHAGGFWELLLHFPFLQGQGESFTSPGCLDPPELFQALQWTSS